MKLFLRKQYLFKIIVYIFLVSLIPVTITGYILYSHFYNIYINELMHSHQKQTAHIAELLQQQFNILRSEISFYRISKQFNFDNLCNNKYELYLLKNLMNRITLKSQNFKRVLYIGSQQALLTQYGAVPISDPFIQTFLTAADRIKDIQVEFFIDQNHIVNGHNIGNESHMYFGIRIEKGFTKDFAFFEIDYCNIIRTILKETTINIDQVMLVDRNGCILFNSNVNLDAPNYLYQNPSCIRVVEDYQADGHYITYKPLINSLL